MDNVKMINQFEKSYINSLDVAQVIKWEHKELLRKIRIYSQQLIDKGLWVENYFLTGRFYIDAKGEERPCIYITEKGCLYIASRLRLTKREECTNYFAERFKTNRKRIVREMKLKKLKLEVVM